MAFYPRALAATCAACLIIALMGCSRRPRHAGEAVSSPQDELEWQLRQRRDAQVSRTDDGGLLYGTNFTAASPESLRVPYELLGLQCESHGGRLTRTAPAQTPAASLSDKAPVPVEIHALLRDADARGLFGEHLCQASEPLFAVELEPVALEGGGRPQTFHLTIHVKASVAEGYDPGAPPGPGLPAVANARGSATASEGPPPAAARDSSGEALAPAGTAQLGTPPPSATGPASAASPSSGTGSAQPPGSPLTAAWPAGSGESAPAYGPSATAPSSAGAVAPGYAVPPPYAAGSRRVSPLDPHPPGTPASGDRLLADPRVFGLALGEDTPDSLAQKLGLQLTAAAHCDPPGAIGLCWDHPASEASALRAVFVDLGAAGQRLAELDVTYPASSQRWLERMLDDQLGPSDVSAPASERSWNWLYATVALTRSAAATVHVHVAHKPTLDRAALPRGAAGRSPAPATSAAMPWQLQLGYESAQSAQTKLKSAGFEITPGSCRDGSPAAAPVFTRTCALRAGKQAHVRSAWVRNVDVGDGRARLAELGYQLDASGPDELLRDLKQQYGEPIPSGAGVLQWWLGPVGITLTRSKNENTLRYYHGRLLQYFIVAEGKRPAAQPTARAGGL